ncbi:P-type conjugative transfer protein TrbG [Panacagrimonas sp.]|uniref:P-type conjugative transfer protein TrbG n=1 Tax=Panacagrimonas sp. TaxID=2480088 RepID=UPI003B520751
MKAVFRIYGLAVILIGVCGCASHGTPPPAITLNEPGPAEPIPEVPKPIKVIEIPKPLPLPCQLKSLAPVPRQMPEPADPGHRVASANEAARMEPTRDGYVNAIQVWPYSDGALYQVYTSPGHVTVIALQAGEELLTVSAGDTLRWIVGDTSSGSGADRRASVLVKPARTDLNTNLVITTNKRTYLLELRSTEQTWMASVSWTYPQDQLLSLRKTASVTQALAPAPSESGLVLEDLRFRYAIRGDDPPWKPLRAFDDGQRVYIQFPRQIAQGELPPLFVIGQQGDAQLVNYRYRAPYYVVDRLFGAAELRLGGKGASVVRIERVDSPSRWQGS